MKTRRGQTPTFVVVFAAVTCAVIASPGYAQEPEEPPEPFLHDPPATGPGRPRLERGPEERSTETGAVVIRDPRRAFIGNWELAAYERIVEDGSAQEVRMKGRLMYDADGNMAAQLMPLDDTGEERIRRYYAYFGSYDIGYSDQSVTHHVEASNVRRWVDTDLTRYYHFDEGRLILELRDGDRVTTRLTWEKLG